MSLFFEVTIVAFSLLVKKWIDWNHSWVDLKLCMPNRQMYSHLCNLGSYLLQHGNMKNNIVYYLVIWSSNTSEWCYGNENCRRSLHLHITNAAIHIANDISFDSLTKAVKNYLSSHTFNDHCFWVIYASL